jgi:hypothetical protein
MINIILNWWAAFGDIAVAATACPAGADGTAQTAAAIIDANSWHGLFINAFIATLIISAVGVVIAYYTDKMGDAFASRWKRALLGTTIIATLFVLILLWRSSVQTLGCQFGEVPIHLPHTNMWLRTSVALLQTPVLFVIISVLLTRAARVARTEPFFHNSRYPF